MFDQLHPSLHLRLRKGEERCEIEIDPVVLIGKDEIVRGREFPPQVKAFGRTATVTLTVLVNSIAQSARLPREQLLPSLLAKGQEKRDRMECLSGRGDKKVTRGRVNMMVMGVVAGMSLCKAGQGFS